MFEQIFKRLMSFLSFICIVAFGYLEITVHWAVYGILA